MNAKRGLKKVQLSNYQRKALRERWKDPIKFRKEALGFQIKDHHIKMQDAINKHNKVLMLLPVGFGKSWYCSYGDVMHFALNNSNERQLVLTLSDRRAADWNKQISAALQSELIKQVYSDVIPERPDRWNTSAITLNRTVNHKEPTITTMGYGGQVESLRENRIWLDDVEDEYIARSAVESINLKERFTRIIERRLEPGGFLGVVGTPFSPTDLYSYLIERGDFHVLKLPAINPDGTSLWPERWSLEELLKIKKNSPAHIWQQAYMLEAVSSDLCKFNWDWLKNQTFENIPDNSYKAQAMDLAISQEKGADYTAIVSGAVDGKNLYIFSIWADKISSGQSKKAHEIAVDFDIDTTYIEENAFQAIVKQEFDKLLPRRNAIGIKNVKNKELRIDGLEPFFREGDIWISNKIPDKYREMLKFEYTSYPLVSCNHILDALQMLVSHTIALHSGEGSISIVTSPGINEWKSEFDNSEMGR